MPDWLSGILEIQEVRAGLVALSITTLTAIGGRLFAARPRIQWGIVNNNHFLVPQQGAPLLSIFVRSFTISNQGRKVAENVEVILNWKPPHIENFPHIPINTSLNKDSRYVININKLNPKEFVNFSMLSSGAELPYITYVRASGYSAKKVVIAPQRMYPYWFNLLAGGLMLVGFLSVFYFLSLVFV